MAKSFWGYSAIIGLAALGLQLFPGEASAQATFAGKRIQVIVPFAPGGATA